MSAHFDFTFEDDIKVRVKRDVQHEIGIKCYGFRIGTAQAWAEFGKNIQTHNGIYRVALQLNWAGFYWSALPSTHTNYKSTTSRQPMKLKFQPNQTKYKDKLGSPDA